MPATGLLERDGVRLGLSAVDRWDAVDQVAMALWDIGATSVRYGGHMRARELSSSTYIGSGIALPHGGDGCGEHVLRPAMVLLQFPGGVSWAGEDVRLCMGIALPHGTSGGVLCSLGRAVLAPWVTARLSTAADTDQVLALLHGQPPASAPDSSVRPVTPSLR